MAGKSLSLVFFKKNDFTCKSMDEVKTLGKIDVFMLMTASRDDTFSVSGEFLTFHNFSPSLPPDG